MVNATTIQSRINNKVFTALGSSATLSSWSVASSGDKWDANPKTYGTPSNITIVPWYDLFNQRIYEQFGDLDKGEMDVAVQASVTVNVDDQIVFKGKTYKAKTIEQYILKDTVLVQAVRLKETVP